MKTKTVKTKTWAAMGLGALIFYASVWVGVPAVSLLLGGRPPWHALRMMSIGWLGGLATVLLIALLACGIRQIMVRR